jgi:hypothetical protein
MGEVPLRHTATLLVAGLRLQNLVRPQGENKMGKALPRHFLHLQLVVMSHYPRHNLTARHAFAQY